MQKVTAQSVIPSPWQSAAVRNAVLVVGASVFMAICARLSVPLPFTPVPLTLGNFAVLLIGLTLGSRHGMAALLLYLAEGAVGLPVFSPIGPGGVAQLLGPTGGFLMSYPLAAFVAGWLGEHGRRNFTRLAASSLAGEAVLFTGGVAWITLTAHLPMAQAAWFGLYPFVFAEIIKIMAAPAIAARVQRQG